MSNNCTIDECGTKYWYNDNNQLHREDGPAIEYWNGDKEWWINGELYNIITVDCQRWYKNYKRHRDDGPAVEYSDGDKFWYKNGLLHREDGPACEYHDKNKKWYINGKKHRLDGPAVELENGTKKWYLNGKKIDCETQEEFEQIKKILIFS